MIVNDSNRRRRTTLVLFAVCAVLQVAIAPNIAIASGHADLMLVFAACIALGVGGTYGMIAAFLGGLFAGLVGSGPVGASAFLFTLMAFFLGMEDRNRLSEDTPSALKLFCIAAPAVELAGQLALVLAGQGGSFVEVVLLRWLPSSIMDCIVFLPFLFFLSRAGSSPAQLGKKKTGRSRQGSYRIKGL